MNDFLYMDCRTSGPTHTTVTEKRAPTDDSARLLNELQKEAENRIIKTIRVQDTNIDCMIHIWRNPMNYTTTFRMVYSLGSKQYVVDHEEKDLISVDELNYDVKIRNIFRRLVKVLAEDIAENVLVKPFMDTITKGNY